MPVGLVRVKKELKRLSGVKSGAVWPVSALPNFKLKFSLLCPIKLL